MNGKNAENSHDTKKLGELVYVCSSVSHHVINAFSSIVSNAELIRTPGVVVPDSSELESSATAIVETALEASEVSRKLIDWARRTAAIAGDQATLGATAVDLNSLIREKVESEKAAPGDGVEWVLNLGSIRSIPGDARSISAMMGYLLQNAREALADGAGTIEVSTWIDQRNWLAFAIKDTGCGMSPDVLKRATEPFFTTKAERDGVGLTIAQGIWRRHRGSLSIDSQPGLGTTIRLSLGPMSLK